MGQSFEPNKFGGDRSVGKKIYGFVTTVYTYRTRADANTRAQAFDTRTTTQTVEAGDQTLIRLMVLLPQGLLPLSLQLPPLRPPSPCRHRLSVDFQLLQDAV